MSDTGPAPPEDEGAEGVAPEHQFTPPPRAPRTAASPERFRDASRALADERVVARSAGCHPVVVRASLVDRREHAVQQSGEPRVEVVAP